ncbi:MAG: malate synthase [Cellvibrionaceae bacterium]|jgi:malate synthase
MPQSIHIIGEITPAFSKILTTEAIDFIAGLERAFRQQRSDILAARQVRQAAFDAGEMPGFLSETADVRAADWQVAPIPADLQKRWVEITGPTDRKMVINALNSGADMFMTDFEDSNSPTWHNMVDGQVNLRDANLRTITLESKGKSYTLGEKVAILNVRPRGWHLNEKHVLVDGKPMSGSIFDFGLYFFHNAKMLLAKGSGPYFYLPKLEGHLEARLWNDVFVKAQDDLGIPQGSIKVTVLIETILAALEMDEILYELRNHMAGLNAGRWDYIFSAIKFFRNQPDSLLPNRDQITMTVPFMHAYSQLLVKTCHKRGAHAIGGMAAFIPRKDEGANELAFAKVQADKVRESNAGYDGTWVAHPGLVPVARAAFQHVLGDAPHQKHVMREDVTFTDKDILNFKVDGGEITETGVRHNLNVGILYIESWLNGVGAAAIYDLMEDAATAEISRSQVWQWIHHDEAKLADGREITAELVQPMIPEELAKIEVLVGSERFKGGKFDQAAKIMEDLVLGDYVDFLTLPAYELL